MMGDEGDGRPREGGWWWNGVRKCLGSLRTQNQGWEMVGFAQHAWRSFHVK